MLLSLSYRFTKIRNQTSFMPNFSFTKATMHTPKKLIGHRRSNLIFSIIYLLLNDQTKLENFYFRIGGVCRPNILIFYFSKKRKHKHKDSKRGDESIKGLPKHGRIGLSFTLGEMHFLVLYIVGYLILVNLF